MGRSYWGTEKYYADRLAGSIRHRTRITTHCRGEGRSSTVVPWTPYDESLTEETWVGSHAQPGPPYRSGGPFDLERVGAKASTVSLNDSRCRGATMLHYAGGLFGETVSRDSNATLVTMGATAISRVLPTVPAFDASVFLGELYQGVPRLIGDSLLRERVLNARAAGSEYLNVEFGWLPIVRDLKDLAKAVKRSRSIIHNYRKGSRKLHHRRFHFDVESSTAIGSKTRTVFPSIGGFTTTASSTQHLSAKRWFEGAFRYYLPIGDALIAKIEMWDSLANKLLGYHLTPETVWNLSPWSWAADWFGNFGDVFKNISNIGSDGLMLKYGYIMSHSREEITTTANLTSSRLSAPYWRVDYREHKVRRTATPYGFGVNFDGLSARQLAVLAAISASRGQKDGRSWDQP